MTELRVCLIASTRFPIAEPFAGGLEAHTYDLASELRDHGHRVSLFAAPGADTGLGALELPVERFASSSAARADVGAPPEAWMTEHHAYLALMMMLIKRGAEDFDIVHNNSLHHLPVAMASMLTIPTVTTLHTPPIPWLESAAKLDRGASTFVAVSDHTAAAWGGTIQARVIRNGVNSKVWTPGPGGPAAVWFGRIAPEKAPHLAIDAAHRARVPLVIAGPVSDPHYFKTMICPRLQQGQARYAGHLDREQLVDLVGRSSVAIVTPAWEEPFGLVAAEALACGTPVAAFARGALCEILSPDCGRLAEPDDVEGLAAAIIQARTLSRTAARDRAVATCSLSEMTRQYTALYNELRVNNRTGPMAICSSARGAA